MTPYRWEGDNLIIEVRVQPRAHADQWATPPIDGRFRVHLTAPPVEGKANTHLCAYVAKLCDVAKSHVVLLSGETRREKRLKVCAPRQLPPGVHAQTVSTNT